jgi:hypothetical protein
VTLLSRVSHRVGSRAHVGDGALLRASQRPIALQRELKNRPDVAALVMLPARAAVVTPGVRLDALAGVNLVERHDRGALAEGLSAVAAEFLVRDRKSAEMVFPLAAVSRSRLTGNAASACIVAPRDQARA